MLLNAAILQAKTLNQDDESGSDEDSNCKRPIFDDDDAEEGSDSEEE
jgi:hypothetical protein